MGLLYPDGSQLLGEACCQVGGGGTIVGSLMRVLLFGPEQFHLEKGSRILSSILTSTEQEKGHQWDSV